MPCAIANLSLYTKESMINTSIVNLLCKDVNTTSEVTSLKSQMAELTERLAQMEQRQLLNKPILTLSETALFLGVKESQIYKLTSQKAIPHSKPNGKIIYFVRDELIEWVRQGRVMTTSEINHAAQSRLQSMAFG